MAEGYLSSTQHGIVYITQDEVTLDNAETDTSAVIKCGDYNHYCLIAWGASADVTVALEISHDGTTYKALYTSSAGNPIVYQGDLNTEFLKVKVTNSSGSDAQAVSCQLRLATKD